MLLVSQSFITSAARSAESATRKLMSIRRLDKRFEPGTQHQPPEEWYTLIPKHVFLTIFLIWRNVGV